MSDFSATNWAGHSRKALAGAELGALLVRHPGWALQAGSLEKTFAFANYFETMAFVNGVAWIAHRSDHHPDLSVHYNRCVVRFNTHDVSGISQTDFECAQAVDALLS